MELCGSPGRFLPATYSGWPATTCLVRCGGSHAVTPACGSPAVHRRRPPAARGPVRDTTDSEWTSHGVAAAAAGAAAGGAAAGSGAAPAGSSSSGVVVHPTCARRRSSASWWHAITRAWWSRVGQCSGLAMQSDTAHGVAPPPRPGPGA